MSKQVLILSTSLRRDSNSDLLAEEFARGARETGHQVEKISLAGKNIQFCQGCLSCQTSGRCFLRDDADAIVQEKILPAQVLVFATPIYYYGMSGQMKTLLDRANPLYAGNPRFREIYLLATAAEDGRGVWQRAAEGLQGWIDCFEGVRLAGVVFGGGVTGPGEIRGSEALKKAYEAGLAL